MNDFGIQVNFKGSYDQALVEVVNALKAEGFGVLTEIDVKETLKKKLDVDFRRYKILGACNPPFAHRALQTDLDVGLLMPCNVIVYEADDGTARIRAIDPMQTIAAQKDSPLASLANEVRERLTRAMAHLSGAR